MTRTTERIACPCPCRCGCKMDPSAALCHLCTGGYHAAPNRAALLAKLPHYVGKGQTVLGGLSDGGFNGGLHEAVDLWAFRLPERDETEESARANHEAH